MIWQNKNVISIGGGKGGIGKSCFAANLGVLLAKLGKRVVLVDADIGGANLHTIVGIKYVQKTLDDFTSGRNPNLEDTLLKTPYANLKLLSSANEILAIAAPNYKDRQKLYNGINKLKTDMVIFDIAAGSYQRAIDFFSLAPYGIILIEPTPTSLENAFSFIKNLLFRILLRIFYHNQEMRKYIIESSDPRLSGKYIPIGEIIQKLDSYDSKKMKQFHSLFDSKNLQLFIIINRIRTEQQKGIAENFAKIIKRYLGLNVAIMGRLPYEPAMEEAISQRIPLCVKNPQSAYTKEMVRIAKKFVI